MLDAILHILYINLHIYFSESKDLYIHIFVVVMYEESLFTGGNVICH